jgi:hypothetical protein
MPKGEKLIGQSKRTVPPHYVLKTFLTQIAFAKTLLTTKGRTYSGGLLFSQKEKHLKNGENLSKLENDFRNHILIPLANCKRI